MKLRTIFFTIALLCLVYFKAIAQDDRSKTVENNLYPTTYIEGDSPKNIFERMAYYKVKGLSIAVIENYQIVWAKGYGFADEEKKIPVTVQTLFQAASISKSLNAVGVLKLVQEKKLDLYIDINNYLVSWKFPYDSLSGGKKITVANLLSHTAGLGVHGFPGYEQGKEIPSVINILDGKKPANSPAVRSMYEPGKQSEYSGGGVTVSQQIVMDVTGLPYARYMDERILKPLGMTGSTYTQPPAGVTPGLLATGYQMDGKEIAGRYHIYPEQAAAGLWTNPTDLARYIIETQLAYEGRSSKVLNQEMTRIRLTPYIDKAAALGVFIDNNAGVKYFQHSGANEGFRSIYYGSLVGGNGVVVLVNSDYSGILPEVVNSVARVYGFKGLDRSIVKKHIRLSESMLDSYTGQYSLSPAVIVTITKENGLLVTQVAGQQKVIIYPENETDFFAITINARIEFNKDAQGNVISATLYQNGQQHEAKKIK